MNKPAYCIYYLACLALVGVQAAVTVYHSSLTVNHTASLSHLQQQRQTLTNRKTELERQTASLLSLNQTQTSLNTEAYQAISHPLVLNVDSTVALR